MVAAPNKYSHDYIPSNAPPVVGARTIDPANPILTIPYIGHGKRNTNKMPHYNNFQHAYGKEQFRDGLTSHDVIGDWASPVTSKSVQPPRDFKSLNKSAVIQGSITSKDITQFRQEFDARLPTGQKSTSYKFKYDDETCFGRSSAEQEDMHAVVSHLYKDDWMNSKEPSEATLAKKRAAKPKDTKASILKAEAAAKLKASYDQDESKMQNAHSHQWKMTKFQSVPARVG